MSVNPCADAAQASPSRGLFRCISTLRYEFFKTDTYSAYAILSSRVHAIYGECRVEIPIESALNKKAICLLTGELPFGVDKFTTLRHKEGYGKAISIRSCDFANVFVINFLDHLHGFVDHLPA